MIDYKLLKEQYKTFKFLDKSVPFYELFESKDYPIVQVNDASYHEIDGKKIIIGFCGVFEWRGNNIYPLDYDSYIASMPVIAYMEFEHDGKTCLDILVESW